MKSASWGRLLAVLAGFVLLFFQNCGNPNHVTFNSNSSENLTEGGGGIDGLKFVHYGTCGNTVGIDTRLFVSNDLTTAYFLTQNCQPVSDNTNRINDILIRSYAPTVLVYQPMSYIFDLQTTVALQKFTLAYCRPTEATRQLDAMVWTTLAQPQQLTGQVIDHDNATTTGALTSTQFGTSTYTGQSTTASYTLSLPTGAGQGQVQYTTPTLANGSDSALECFSQSMPAGLPQSAAASANSWVADAWGVCSAICNGGSQSRTVRCEDSNGTVLTPAQCSGTAPAATQACNTQACMTYNWVQGGFGACSFACGGGTQTQTVSCEEPNGTIVFPSDCSTPSPPTMQACNTQACAMVSYAWSAGGWGACPDTNGGIGVMQTRTVTCENAATGAPAAAGECSSLAELATSQACCPYSAAVCALYASIGRAPNMIGDAGAQYWQNELNAGLSLTCAEEDAMDVVQADDAVGATLNPPYPDINVLLNSTDPNLQSIYFNQIAGHTGPITYACPLPIP